MTSEDQDPLRDRPAKPLSCCMQEDVAAARGEYYLAIAADPWTWGWVAQKLAEGALSWLGGKLLASLLDEERFESVVERAVVELKGFIRAELENAEISRIENEFRALRLDLQEWANAPETSGDRLQNATTRSNVLLTAIEGRGAETKGVYIDIVSLRLFVLIARRNQFNDSGEWKNMVAQVHRAKPIIIDWINDTEKFWNTRLNGVKTPKVHTSPGRRPHPIADDPGYPGYYFGVIDDNGTELRTRNYDEGQKADAEEEANLIYERRRAAYR